MTTLSPSTPETVALPRRRNRLGLVWATAIIAVLEAVSAVSAAPLPVCAGADRAGRASSCIYDGDTGWQDGVKWRLKDIDAPEIGHRSARCRAEQLKGLRARDRLRKMMANGYTIVNTGRDDPSGGSLVDIQLADGRDAGLQLMSEGIVQARPNTGSVWCGG